MGGYVQVVFRFIYYEETLTMSKFRDMQKIANVIFYLAVWKALIFFIYLPSFIIYLHLFSIYFNRKYAKIQF